MRLRLLRALDGRRISMLMLALAAMAGIDSAEAAVMTTHVPEAVAAHTAHPLSELPADRRLDLAIALPLRNEAQLDAFLKSLYDPASLQFRHYLDVSEFTARFGPSQADYAALLRFLRASGLQVTATSGNRRVVEVSGRVSQIEQVFGVRLQEFRDDADGHHFFAPDREPHPALGIPLLHIEGLDDYRPPVSHLHFEPQVSGTGSGPFGSLLGSDVRAAYYGGTTLTGKGQSLAQIQFVSFNLSDVQKYFAVTGQPLNVPVVGVSVDGMSVSCVHWCFDAEPVLDISQAISMAPGLSQVVAYVGKLPMAILNRIASDNSSRQISSSWGWRAASPAIDDPVFKEFAAQGQSFFDASGDFGYQLKKGKVWPADDQWVTGVGGTDLVTAGPGGPWLSETGWAYSGGGPSPDAIPIPDYQVPFINAQNQGTPTLRNVPDVAGASSNFYLCFDNLCSVGGAGTSFAAPAWAGFAALANEQAESQGRAPIGFVNPVLYAIAAGAGYSYDFHDQTAGYNGLFNAVTGYDLVTGLGSPNGQALIDALVAGE